VNDSGSIEPLVIFGTKKKNLIKKRIIAVYIILFTVKFYSFEENSNLMMHFLNFSAYKFC